jgi:hypothetical protein
MCKPLPRTAYRDLFQYRPERLVVGGLRCTLAGYEFGDPLCWDRLWDFYAGEVGVSATRRLMGDLQYWVRAIRKATEPAPTYYPFGCRYICRDECALLSLLSALQHKDEECAAYAIGSLPAADRHKLTAAVRQPSEAFANAMLELGEVLLKIPTHVLRSVVEAPRAGCSCANAG